MKSYVNVLAVLVIASSVQALVACSPAKPITDPVGVTKAVFDAINNKQAERAATYFAEDAEFVAAFGQPVGNAKILSFLKTTVIPYKMNVEITDISKSNGTVTGTFTLKDISAYQTPTNMQVTAVVTDGKVKSMTWSPKK
jgi:hypothetical protein